MATTINYSIAQLEADQKASEEKAKNTTKKNLNTKDEFLNLLMTQLQNQDPLKPMDDSQFVAQMAQFSALEQMQNLNTSYTTTKAMSLIGKYVTGTYDDGTEKKEVSGTVDSVKIADGKAYALVNGQDVLIDDIEEVSDISQALNNADITKYTGLIGKNVTCAVKGLKDGDIYKMDGTVYSTSIVQAQPVATLNNVKAKVDSLTLSDDEKATITSVKAYLQDNVGKSIKVVATDANGIKTNLTGKVVSVSGDDKNPDIVFDDVKVTVDSIAVVAEGGSNG